MAAQQTLSKVTFEPEQVIQPFYTGGDVALSEDGDILATCVGEDVVLTDFVRGRNLARIEGDGEVVTALALTKSAEYLIVCSRSLAIRTYSINKTEGAAEAKLHWSHRLPSAPVVSICVDATSTLLATGSADGIVKVWDIRRGDTTHTFHGHGGVVSALTFFQYESPKPRKKDGANKHKSGTANGVNGNMPSSTWKLASGSEEGKIRIWDLSPSKKCLAILDSHVSVVRSLEFNAAKQTLLSASRDKAVILWDASTWKPDTTIPVLEAVEAAGLIGDGSVFYTGGENGQIRLWNVDTGSEISTSHPSPNESRAILQVQKFEAGRRILCVRADQTLAIYSTEIASLDTNKRITPSSLPLLRQVSGTHDEIIDLAFVGRDSNMLAIATNTEEIHLLSLQSSQSGTTNGAAQSEGRYFGADVGVLEGHQNIIICLDVDWSGNWLVTGAKDNTARLWRLDAGNQSFQCVAILTGHAESLGAVALPKVVPPSGTNAYTSPLEHMPSFVITGSQDKTIKKWDTNKIEKNSLKISRAAYTRKAHDKDINAIDINSDAQLFASASQDRTVKIWSLTDGETTGILRGHRRGVWTVKFAPKDTPSIRDDSGQSNSSKGLVLTGSGDKTVKIWNLSDFSCLRTFEGHTNSVLKVVWLSSATNRDNTEESAEDFVERKHQIKANGIQIASAGADGLVKVWDANNGESQSTLDNHTERVWAIAQNSATGVLVSGGGDGVMTFWKDTTTTTQAAAAAASTERVEQDQQLQNYMRAGSYREAIILALHLNHPARLLSLFTSVVNRSPPEAGSLCGVKAVDEVLANLADEQLLALLQRLRDWNANAKTAHVAQRILWTILKSYPSDRLLTLRPIRSQTSTKTTTTNTQDLLDVLKAYTERHYRRMEESIDESYLMEYTLQEMDDISATSLKPNGVRHEDNHEDVMMLG